MIKPLIALWKKEFLQMVRDPAMLRVLIIAPLIQLVILSYAINTELKNMRVAIIDYDQSPQSQRLIEKIFATGYFIPAANQTNSQSTTIRDLYQSKAELVIVIPRDFAENLENSAEVQAIIDGQHSNVAAIGLGYLQRMILQYNLERLSEKKQINQVPLIKEYQIIPIVRVWFNPDLEPKWFFVPGISVLLITITATLLSGLSIVKEKEIGTIELLLVVPMKRWQLIAGKIVPFYFLSILILTISLIVGMLWFRIPFVGSPIDLWIGVTLYLFFLLSLGLLISTLSKTQSQAMFLVWFLLIFSILTSGFFFPVENMPNWLQSLTVINPMKYMMVIVRGVLVKGANLFQLFQHYGMLALLGILTFICAIVRYQQKLV